MCVCVGGGGGGGPGNKANFHPSLFASVPVALSKNRAWTPSL